MKTSYDDRQVSKSERQSLAKRAGKNLGTFKSKLISFKARDINSILDLACGHGIRTAILAEEFPMARVVGIDRSSNFIYHANKNFKHLNNIEFKKSDVLASGLEEAKYDLIYSRLFFQHVSDISELLDVCYCSLKPNGLLIIEDIVRSEFKFHGYQKEWTELWPSIIQGQVDKGGSPDVALKILDSLPSSKFSKFEYEKIVYNETCCDRMAELLETLIDLYVAQEIKENAKELLSKSIENNISLDDTWYFISAKKE